VPYEQLPARGRDSLSAVRHLITGGARFIGYEEAYEAGFEDMLRRIPDTSRIESLLGWHPTRNLDTILSDVIDFHRDQEFAKLQKHM